MSAEELRQCHILVSPQQRLNNRAESALISGYGGKRMTCMFNIQQYPDYPSRDRLLLSDSQILDEHFRTLSYIPSVIRSENWFPAGLGWQWGNWD